MTRFYCIDELRLKWKAFIWIGQNGAGGWSYQYKMSTDNVVFSSANSTIHQATTDGSRSVLLLEVPTKYRFGEDERGWGGGADGNLFCNKNGNWGLIIIYSWPNGTCSKSSSHCNILTQVLSKWCLQNKKPHEIFCTCLRLFTHKYTFLADKYTKSVAVFCDSAKHF